MNVSTDDADKLAELLSTVAHAKAARARAAAALERAEAAASTAYQDCRDAEDELHSFVNSLVPEAVLA